MEQSKKQLKTLSIVLLALAGLTLLNAIFELVFGSVANAEIPEGSPDNILLITQIFLAVVTVLLLLPQVYVGLKGLKMAKNPDSSKGHIVWATILFVLSVISMISPIVAAIKQEDVLHNIAGACSILVEVTIFFNYIYHARIVSKGN